MTFLTDEYTALDPKVKMPALHGASLSANEVLALGRTFSKDALSGSSPDTNSAKALGKY